MVLLRGGRILFRMRREWFEMLWRGEGLTVAEGKLRTRGPQEGEVIRASSADSSMNFRWPGCRLVAGVATSLVAAKLGRLEWRRSGRVLWRGGSRFPMVETRKPRGVPAAPSWAQWVDTAAGLAG